MSPSAIVVVSTCKFVSNEIRNEDLKKHTNGPRHVLGLLFMCCVIMGVGAYVNLVGHCGGGGWWKTKRNINTIAWNNQQSSVVRVCLTLNNLQKTKVPWQNISPPPPPPPPHNHHNSGTTNASNTKKAQEISMTMSLRLQVCFFNILSFLFY